MWSFEATYYSYEWDRYTTKLIEVNTTLYEHIETAIIWQEAIAKAHRLIYDGYDEVTEIKLISN